MSDQESIVFTDTDLPTNVAYVALGHIHQPQAIGGRSHVRYSGSVEKLDLGEQRDNKSVTILEVGPAGLVGEPLLLPLPATPVYAIDLDFLNSDLETELYRLHSTTRTRNRTWFRSTSATLQGSTAWKKSWRRWKTCSRAGTPAPGPRPAPWGRA